MTTPGLGRMPGGLDPHGPAAEDIATLWWLMLWLGLGAFIVFAGVLARAMFRRRGRGADVDPVEHPDAARSGRYLRGWVVGLGFVMTTVVLIVVLGMTVVGMRALRLEAGPGALRLDLVAHQWYWDVRYPDAGVSARNTVRIPVGRAVELHLSSADVIHSFWVPALAGKIDAVPGKTNTLVIEADEPGTYRGQCAEFCGLHHAEMRVTVVAMERGAFERWLDEAG